MNMTTFGAAISACEKGNAQAMVLVRRGGHGGWEFWGMRPYGASAILCWSNLMLSLTVLRPAPMISACEKGTIEMFTLNTLTSACEKRAAQPMVLVRGGAMAAREYGVYLPQVL